MIRNHSEGRLQEQMSMDAFERSGKYSKKTLEYFRKYQFLVGLGGLSLMVPFMLLSFIHANTGDGTLFKVLGWLIAAACCFVVYVVSRLGGLIKLTRADAKRRKAGLPVD